MQIGLSQSWRNARHTGAVQHLKHLLQPRCQSCKQLSLPLSVRRICGNMKKANLRAQCLPNDPSSWSTTAPTPKRADRESGARTPTGDSPPDQPPPPGPLLPPAPCSSRCLWGTTSARASRGASESAKALGWRMPSRGGRARPPFWCGHELEVSCLGQRSLIRVVQLKRPCQIRKTPAHRDSD